ncbi:hypothetical protein SUGI_1086470 [Cryptomeria japonica]|uniref:uncharacterized protein LOC131030732 isoform X3 n=1 Tax=Cryptomeria japonica TaxID=3369 RepID=UPI0024147240|nr:uncharacterized protein LOC131030732 isoform X3 [Cryptomeria japonica]GLJ51026.1 hypothetical protein SUGI_1086470 [Cryptomeria japonica]
MSSSEAAANPEGDKACEIEDEEEKEVEQLEAEVKDLAEKVIELRRTMKLVFRDKLEALLLAKRPTLPEDKPSSSEGSKVTQGTGTSLATAREEQEVDQETAAQIALLKRKIAANVAAMPATTERMKLCVEKIDRLDQYKVNIDYVFTKKMDSDR